VLSVDLKTTLKIEDKKSMGIIDLIKNSFFDNGEDYIDVFDKAHLKEKIDIKNNRQNSKHIYKVYHAKTVINPHKKTTFQHKQSQANRSNTQKSSKKSNYKENVKKGKEYEKYVGKYIESFGFDVDYRGLKMGRKDGGIDLIARKNNTYVLIQCKNWSKKRVTQKDIRVFIGDYYAYLDEHPELRDKNTKAYFYVSNDLYDKGAKNYANSKDFLELKVLKI